MQDAKILELLEGIRLSQPMLFNESVSLPEKGMHFILNYLERNEGREIIAADLAKELRVSTARITSLLKKMEQKGWICKGASAWDARKTVVCITGEGRAVAAGTRKELVSLMKNIMKDVSVEEIETYIAISSKIKHSMAAATDHWRACEDE